MSDEQHKNRKRNCEGNAQFSDTREYSSSDDDDGPIVRQMKKRPKVYSSSSYGSDSSEEEIRANPNGNRVLRFHSSRSNSSSSSDDSSSSSSAFSPTHRPNRATARLRSTSNSSCSPNEQNHIESSSDSNDTSADKCPICLARFRGQEIGCPDSCDHLFCASCITEWGKNVNTCPVDRSQFGAVLVRAHIHSSHVTRSIPIVVAQQERDEQQQDDNTVCEVCGRADREETLLLCDGCDRGWHMECLRPPLVAVPEGLWYCELCARDVLEARIAIESRNRAIPRTRLIERVRTRVMNQNRRNNNNNTQSTAAVANTAGPSTSTGRRSVGTTTLINVRTMTTTRSIKRRKVRRRRRKRRPPLNGQQVHINYELDENNGQKLAIRTRICTKSKSRRRRKHKNSRKSPKPCSKAQRERRRHREVFGYRSKKKLSVKERLAQQLGMCRTQTWYNLLPDVNGRPPGGGGGSTGHVATVAGSSRTSIIPQLHLFGHRDTLEYFSDSSDGVNDDDSLGGCGGLVTARTAAASTEAALLRRTARTKAAVLPLGNRSNNSQESRATQTTATSISQPPAAGTETAILTTTTAPAAVDTISGDTSSTMDILSTILESQLQFHARHSTLTLNRDGSIQIASRALAQMRHARYAAHNTPITSTSTAPLQTTSLPNNIPTTSKSLVVSADSNIVHSPSNIAQDQLFGVSTTTTITPTLAPVVVKTAAATGGYNQGQGTSGGFGGSSGGTNADRSTGGNNNNNRDCVSTSTGGAGGGSSGAGGSGSGGGGGDGGQHGNQYIDASDLYDPEEDTQDDEADEQQLTRDSHQEQPTDYSMAAIQQKDDDEDIYSDIETTVSTSQQQQQSNIGNDDDNRETIENENAIQSQQLTAPLTVDNLVDYDDDDDDDDDNVDLVIDDSKPQDKQQEETSLVSSSTSNNNNMVDNMAATMERMEQHVKAMLMLVDGNEDSVNFQPDGAQDGGGGLAETPHSTCDDDNNKMAEDQRDEDDSDDDGCPNFNIYSSESVSMATNMADQPEKCPDQRPVEANIDVSLPNTQEEEEQLMLNDGSTELISTSDENSPNRTIPTADQQPKKLTNNNLYSDSDEEIEIKIDQPADQLDQLTDNELITDIRQMTEDISEDEDVSEPETEQQPAERSFTPCLDENNMAVPKASCEDLEAISDEENRNDFSADGQQGHLIVELEINAKESELDFSGTKTIEDETEEEAHIEKTRKEQSVNNEAVSAGDKQLKAKEANKTKKTDANKSIEPSFKKLSKNNKDRNYRNDKEDSNKKRIRDKSRENSRDNDRRRDKDKENRRDERRRNKEKRKEIQRYSVRSLIADKPTVRKDRFGRDEEFRKTKSRSRSKEKQKRDKRLSSTSSASPIAQRHNRRQRSGSTPASQFRRSTNRRSLRSISRSRCSTSGNRGYNQQQQQQQQRSSSHDSTSPTFRDQQQQYILGRMIYDQQQQQQQSRYQRFNRSRSYTPAMMPDCIDQGVVVVAAPPPPPPSSADRKKRKGKGAEKRVQSRSRSGPRGGAKKRKKDRADGAGRGKRGKQQRERSRRRERDRDRLNKRQRVDNRDQVHSSPPLHQHPHHISPSQLTITHQQPLTPPLQQRGSGGGGDYTPPPLRQLYEPRPSRHLTPAPLNSAAASWTPPRATTNQQSNPTDGVQSESLTVILTNDRNKRKEKRNKKDKRVSRRGRRDRTPPPSKEVFASGDNILVSVSFNKETANATSAAAPTGEPCATLGTTAAAAVTAALNSISGRNKRKRAATPPPQQQQLQQQRRQRQRHLSQFQLQKPVAIIDLDRSPFHELTPSPRDVIVLSDDDEINVERDVELVRRMVALDEETDDDDDDDDGDGGGDDDMEDGEVRNSRRPAVAMCEHHQQVALQQQKNNSGAATSGSGLADDLTSNLLCISSGTVVATNGVSGVGSSGPKTPPEPTASSSNTLPCSSPRLLSSSALVTGALGVLAASAVTTLSGASTPAPTPPGVATLAGSQVKFTLVNTKTALPALRASLLNPLHDPDDEEEEDRREKGREKEHEDGDKDRQQEGGATNASTTSTSGTVAVTTDHLLDLPATLAAGSTTCTVAGSEVLTPAVDPGGSSGARGPNTPPNEPPTSAPSSPDLLHPHRCPHNHHGTLVDNDDDDTDDDIDKDVYDPFDPTKSRSPSPEPSQANESTVLLPLAADGVTAGPTGIDVAAGGVGSALDQLDRESHTPPLVTASGATVVADIQPADSQTPATTTAAATAATLSTITGVATSTSSTAPGHRHHHHHHHHHKTSTATSSTSGPHKIMAIIDLTPEDLDDDGGGGAARLPGRSSGASGHSVGPPLMTPAGKKMAAMAAAQAQQQQVAQQQQAAAAAATSITSVLNQIVQVASSMFPPSTAAAQSKPTSSAPSSSTVSGALGLSSSVTSSSALSTSLAINSSVASSIANSSSTSILSANTAGYTTMPPCTSTNVPSAITSSNAQQSALQSNKINVLNSTIFTAALAAAAATAAPSTATSSTNNAATNSLLSTVISNAVAAANANANNNSPAKNPKGLLNKATIGGVSVAKPSPLSKKSTTNVFGLGGGEIDLESPYSPGSSDYEDLFDPPTDLPTNRTKSSKKSSKTAANLSSTAPSTGAQSVFDNLFGNPSPSNKFTSASKVQNKKGGAIKKSAFGKTKMVGVKIDEDSLKVMDEVPNSAVEMQVKDKFLKKLNRQERVVEEVKLVLKPHYNKKHITKEEYKDVLRRAVPKICHNKSGEINPKKIQNLIEAYVKKLRQSKKVTSSSSKM